MAVVVGSFGLIEEPVVWNVAAGADSYAGPFLLTGPAPALTPVNLTGYTGACEIRLKPGEALLARLTTENGGMVIDPLVGSVLLWLSAAITEAWEPTLKKAVFDVELYTAAAPPAPIGVTALCAGTLAIRPNVTKDA